MPIKKKQRSKKQCKHETWAHNVIRQLSHQHTNAQDSTVIEVYKVNNRNTEGAIIKECASTQRILLNNVLTPGAECAIKKPSISHIERHIRHIIQQQRSGSGPIPKSDDLELLEKNLSTKNCDNFLFKDGNLQQSEQRFLIFGTEYNLQLLRDNKQWFVERTFKSCADNFYQIFFVHCPDNGITLLCIYALLPHKKHLCDIFGVLKR